MYSLLPVNLAPLADVCAKESHARFGATSGVKIDIENGQFKAYATDGRRLIKVTGACDDPKPSAENALQYPDLQALQSAPNGQLGAIVPAKEWSKIFKDAERLTKKTRYPILRNVATVFGDKASTFATTNMQQETTAAPLNVEGRFPNCEQVIPTKTPVYSVYVDPILLAETLEAVAKLGTTEEHKGVTLNFQGPQEPFTITAPSATNLNTLAVIVPLVGDKTKHPHTRSLKDMEREIEELKEALKQYQDADEERMKERDELETERDEERNHRESITETVNAKCDRIDELHRTIERIHALLEPFASTKGTVARQCYDLAGEQL